MLDLMTRGLYYFRLGLADEVKIPQRPVLSSLSTYFVLNDFATSVKVFAIVIIISSEKFIHFLYFQFQFET